MLYDIRTALPPLRRDIQINASDDGATLLLRDTIGYAENDLTISSNALAVLEMMDGRNNAAVLEVFFREQFGAEIPADDIAGFAAVLDREGYLYSQNFSIRRRQFEENYARQPVRRSVCAGGAYPSDPDDLREFLQNIMESSPAAAVEAGASGIIAPHIDLNVGGASYSPAYHAISGSDADLFVIYATSHYAGYDLIIPTDKDFETPLGLVRTDRALLEAIRTRLPFEVTRNDIAHRPEHSIELELIFLQHLFPGREFTILPLLVTSFAGFFGGDAPPCAHDKVRLFAEAVRGAVAESGRKAVFISSGDLGHIGRKFGDDFDAEDKLPELARADASLLSRLAACDRDGFFAEIAACDDTWKVCGTAPDYMLLETLRPGRGAALCYDQWSERETRSAVSFASVAFYGGE